MLNLKARVRNARKWWNGLSSKDQQRLIELLMPRMYATATSCIPSDFDLLWMHRNSMTTQEWEVLNSIGNNHG